METARGRAAAPSPSGQLATSGSRRCCGTTMCTCSSCSAWPVAWCSNVQPFAARIRPTGRRWRPPCCSWRGWTSSFGTIHFVWVCVRVLYLKMPRFIVLKIEKTKQQKQQKNVQPKKHIKAKQNRTEPNVTERNRTEPNGTERNRTEPNESK